MRVRLLTALVVAQGQRLFPGEHDIDASHLAGLPEGTFEVLAARPPQPTTPVGPKADTPAPTTTKLKKGTS